MGTRAAVYTRISKDDGSALGVSRQENDCRRLCKQKGWSVTEVYTDNDVTASGRKRRPAYEAMLASIQRGEIDAVVVYHLNRLHRRPAELESFITVADERGIALANVSGDVDLGTSAGRLVARLMGATAAHELERTTERIRRKHAELAEAGKLSGTGTRPFGYEDDFITIRADEAKVIRQIVRQFLNGKSLRAIAQDLNSKGITTTTTGKQWQVPVLRRMVTSARIAGLREHRQNRKVTLSKVPAVWKGIVSPEDHERVLSRMSTISAGKRGWEGKFKHVLSGVAECGLCGNHLTIRKSGDRADSYGCVRMPGNGGCFGVRINAAAAEQIVTGALLAAIPEVSPPKQTKREDVDLLRALRDTDARMEDTDAMFADGTVDRASYTRIRDRLTKTRTDLRQEIERMTAPTVPDVPTGPRAVKAWWESASIEDRRRVLRFFVSRVVIHPAKVRGSNRVDPDRIRVVFAH